MEVAEGKSKGTGLGRDSEIQHVVWGLQLSSVLMISGVGMSCNCFQGAIAWGQAVQQHSAHDAREATLLLLWGMRCHTIGSTLEMHDQLFLYHNLMCVPLCSHHNPFIVQFFA